MPTAAGIAAENLLEAEPTRAYLRDTVRVWLGLDVDASSQVPALPDELARSVLRLEEWTRPERDRWGRWEHDLSERSRSGALWEPEVDRWLAARRVDLRRTAPLEPLWPEDRPFAVCVSNDVDLVSARSTPRQVLRHARAGLERDGRALIRFARPPVRVARSLRAGVSRTPSARETLERSAELAAERGVTASYLFTTPGRSRYDCTYAPTDPVEFRGARRQIRDVMRALAHDGFDVGLHGSYLAGRRGGMLADERSELERATGLTIETSRQHLLHWDVRWTPRLQEAAGLRVDSSLGFNRGVGYRAGTSLPFRLFDLERQRPLDLLEVPLVFQDVSLLGAWGLALGVEAAMDAAHRFLDKARETNGLATVVFHPDKLVHGDWRALYESVLDAAVARGAWLTSLAELDEWWSARERRILGR